MIKKRLREDTVEQAANSAETKEEKQDIIEAGVELEEPLVSDDAGEIEAILNDKLADNIRAKRRGNRNFSNVLFVGEAGTGKTARIRTWARKHNINLVTLKAGELDDTDTGGVIAGNIAQQVAVRLASTEFDQLGKKNSVLFLDEWNRAPSTVRQSLLTLIQDHKVTDPRVDGRMRYIPNFLFTVAAINPDDEDYDVHDLDPAEKGRVKTVYVTAKVEDWKKYMEDYYTKLAEIAEKSGDEYAEEDSLIYRRIASLASAIASDPDFKFNTSSYIAKCRERDDWNGLITSPRNLTNALEDARGEKERFIKNFDAFCNNLDLPKMETILTDYKDIEDKSNQALKDYETNDQIFKSQRDRDIDYINSLQNDLKSQIDL